MLRVDEDDIIATDATNDPPTATISGKLSDFFRVSKGDHTTAQRFTIQGDRAAAKQFIRALTGAMG